VWTYHVRIDGKLRRLRLGRYPEMTLAEAREEWRLARKRLAAGELPTGATNNTSGALSTILTQWLETWRRDKRPNTIRAVERQISSYVLPAWRSRDLQSIGKHDVLTLLDSIAHRGAVVQARRLYATLSSFFKWCAKRDLIASSPMSGIERKDLGSESSRERVLTDAEMSKLLDVCRGANQYDPFLSATYLLALTGCRRDEIGNLRWDEINGDTIELPASRMKNGLPHDVPITSHIKAVLDQIPRVGPYVFTSNGKTAIKGWPAAKARIDAAAGVTGWQIRDLRRTMQTGLQRLGFAEDVIDATIAHVKVGVKRVYMRHKYAAEKRAALEAWGEYLKVSINV
jgi:integrase